MYRTKYDFQNEYTKLKIRNAFLDLYQKKRIEKITVSEICAIAEVHRSTFYRHYDDIYAVLEEIEEVLLKELKQVYAPFQDESVVQISEDSGKKYLQRILYSYKNNRKAILVLLSYHIEETFYQRLRAELYDVMEHYYQSLNREVGRYAPYYIQMGVDMHLSYILKWLEEDDIPIEEFYEFYRNSIVIGYQTIQQASQASK